MPCSGKKMKGTYRGKSLKEGGGGRFARMKEGIMREHGYSEERASAIAAAQGRAKLGAKKMAKLSAKGRERAEKKGK